MNSEIATATFALDGGSIDLPSQRAQELIDSIMDNYLLVDRNFSRMDFDTRTIVAAGSRSLAVARHAGLLAKWLYDLKLDPILVCSGDRGPQTGDWEKTEAEMYSDEVRKIGFGGTLLIEPESTNTGDNLIYSYNKLCASGWNDSSWVIVCLPAVQRRVLAVAQKHFPHLTTFITSPDPKSLTTNNEEVVPVVLGEVWRLSGESGYARQGFQIKQEIPASVLEASMLLQSLGYRRR